VLFALPFFAIGLTGVVFVFSPLFVVAGAIIVASPLARFIAEPAGGLFYPIQRSSKPAPMYSIPQSKRAKGLYEEAKEGCEKIAEPDMAAHAVYTQLLPRYAALEERVVSSTEG
jgi:hypothetical protein